MNVHERFKDYNKNHCWQYEIRQRNFLLDLQESGMSEKDAQGLCIADFDFAFVPKEDKQGCQEIKEFKCIAKKIKASSKEITENPRSRSAIMRVGKKS